MSELQEIQLALHIFNYHEIGHVCVHPVSVCVFVDRPAPTVFNAASSSCRHHVFFSPLWKPVENG